MRHLHFDTTSVSVWGEYAAREADGPEGLNVTFGYSKDLRPDLKQFLMQMLCCRRNIPLLGGCADGNASDKTVNNAVLTNLSKHMARHGLCEGAFIYIADAALVTLEEPRGRRREPLHHPPALHLRGG
jgi:transposase